MEAYDTPERRGRFGSGGIGRRAKRRTPSCPVRVESQHVSAVTRILNEIGHGYAVPINRDFPFARPDAVSLRLRSRSLRAKRIPLAGNPPLRQLRPPDPALADPRGRFWLVFRAARTRAFPHRRPFVRSSRQPRDIIGACRTNRNHGDGRTAADGALGRDRFGSSGNSRMGDTRGFTPLVFILRPGQDHTPRNMRTYPITKQSRDREGAVMRFVAEKPLAYARGSDRNTVLG
jgi:hypothetical protein